MNFNMCTKRLGYSVKNEEQMLFQWNIMKPTRQFDFISPYSTSVSFFFKTPTLTGYWEVWLHFSLFLVHFSSLKHRHSLDIGQFDLAAGRKLVLLTGAGPAEPEHGRSGERPTEHPRRFSTLIRNTREWT